MLSGVSGWNDNDGDSAGRRGGFGGGGATSGARATQFWENYDPTLSLGPKLVSKQEYDASKKIRVWCVVARLSSSVVVRTGLRSLRDLTSSKASFLPMACCM